MLIENVFCFTLVLFMTDGAGADPKTPVILYIYLKKDNNNV